MWTAAKSASGGWPCFKRLRFDGPGPERLCRIWLASERFCAEWLRARGYAGGWAALTAPVKTGLRTIRPVVLLPGGAGGWARVGAVRFARSPARSEVLPARPRILADWTCRPPRMRSLAERFLRRVIFGAGRWALVKRLGRKGLGRTGTGAAESRRDGWQLAGVDQVAAADVFRFWGPEGAVGGLAQKS